jgi:hypothetical protein
MYVYTNSRVLSQNVMFMDEATKEWHKQSVVFKEFDSDGPIDLFHEYDVIFDVDTPDANMDRVFTNGENTSGQSKDANAFQGFEIGEDERELQDWATHHVYAPHPTAPIHDDKFVPIVSFIIGARLLNINNI